MKKTKSVSPGFREGRGYTQAELEKISSGNMLRVLKAAEAYSVSQKGQPPIETPVAK